ncbi:FdhF/YdeP family oxidoreductase [Winogradskya consettensis]|uniref:Molybdopterin oxidoreductase alpha subunit n=1 Tax=Winogradskya consettensis TaxID=113560 RepID=A0A919VWT5_9ACTN|nr:FdhF/YdeP family oxidoreductase [Actinoplanes consettensis]GIM79871.1 molybdopterin oxidoreductase alpha subunit [Actinoplanes consettensis]
MDINEKQVGPREAAMLGGAPGVPSAGRGPAVTGKPRQKDYTHPAAGWGAAVSVGKVVAASGVPGQAAKALFTMNHEGSGFDCPGCAWPDATDGLKLDLCENGIKHVTWEMTAKRAGRELFADAFELVGRALRGLDSPHRAAFYTSGRLANEATFLYQLWVREYGTNNLPDCSNMCHEASGRALQASLGTGKGTCDLNDWEKADAIVVMGVNAASNAPRMLTALSDAYRRGAQIVHINPLVEAASRDTIVPHEILAMATFRPTRIGTMNVQPRIGGDMALLRGVAKATIEAGAVSPDFLDRYTDGFEAYRNLVVTTSWEDIVAGSGVDEEQIRQLAGVYIRSERTVISWCLGLTQQEHGVDTVREIVNLLLLRGNLGREGAGPSPVRGHSNVQGNRTCGIDHRPTAAFLDKLAEVCGIDPPREHGLDTVATIEAMRRGDVRVFVGMGGNFVLAAPDTAYTSQALRQCDLTVHVSTKLNRSHLVHGRDALILPCIARSERDVQKTGPQSISVEDAMSEVHLSRGSKRPASPYLLSEPAIIAGMAAATLPESRTPWAEYTDDYDRIRDTMAEVLDGFAGFNRKVRDRLGFRIPQPAREREFLTPSGHAEFSAAALPDLEVPPGFLMLSTMRSHDQWNTTIYSNDDRYRGLRGTRTVIFMNERDMADRGLAEFDRVDVTSLAKDGTRRHVYGYQAMRYDVPPGNAAGYMPELNVLCPIGDVSSQSDQPLMKHVVVEIVASA